MKFRALFAAILLYTFMPYVLSYEISNELKHFLAFLEPYTHQQNEIVFVLDESGSIGADVFPQVLLFTEVTSRFFSLSAAQSRVAVVTYSTNPITHIDYIKDPTGNNMCTFLRDMKKIGYVGEWTHTGDALYRAKLILENSRPQSNRIIILMSDGQSQDVGVNLRQISTELKDNGVIIFCVGVAAVNDEELNYVATSSDHVYILEKFDDIVELNTELKGDTEETSWDIVNDKSLCPKTCDENADCFCGTKGGFHECTCKKGFYGQGYEGNCFVCLKGTYKSAPGSECTPCPANSTTSGTGSTLQSECKCIFGHEGEPEKGKPCKPIRCPRLQAPIGGSLVPANCGNTYNSECSFRCNTGHCPYSCSRNSENVISPSQVQPHARMCLETGLWSGEDFRCEKIRCPLLDYPKGGTHNCTNSQTDFDYGNVCYITCGKGYRQTGSEYRTCRIDGSWTGNQASCTALQCEPLKINKKLRLKPKTCSTKKMDFRSVCQYYCKKGFVLHVENSNSKVSGTRQCMDNQKWSNIGEKLSCKDDERPMFKLCTKSQEKQTDPGQATAVVTWDLPVAIDNVAVKELKIIHPPSVKKPPAAFPIGITKIVYSASDTSELNNTCSFDITVVDKEPPRILSCPNDIEIKHSTKEGIEVKWAEPAFQDNSGSFSSISNRESGSKFYWGPASTVDYIARDASGNSASCTFKVIVKAHSCIYVEPPLHGYLSCDTWSNGQFCKVSCEDGYEFPTSVESVYYCHQKSKQWGGLLSKEPLSFPLWPDCGAVQPINSVNVGFKVKYSVETCSDDELEKHKEAFIKALLAKHHTFCSPKRNCKVKNVKISCWKPTNTTTRRRRSLISVALDGDVFSPLLQERSLRRLPRRAEGGEISFSFDIEITPDEDCSDCPKNFTMSEEVPNIESTVIDGIKSTVKQTVKDVFDELQPGNERVAYEIVPNCKAGSVRKNNTCVNCPAGTYFNNRSRECEDCPQNYYQDNEASFSCKGCPIGRVTQQKRSKYLSDCKGFCLPGTISDTGKEPCTVCHEGFYSDREGARYCKACPNGLSTGFKGASSQSQCSYPCDVGSYSSNGYPPCISCPRGSYQWYKRATECTKCPNGTVTVVEGASSNKFCKNINFCTYFKNCMHGSTCVNLNDGYKCICPPGFAGVNCHINIDDCSGEVCENNATCVDGVDTFSCKCQSGFSGLRCEFNIDDCQSHRCQNGATCEDRVNGYACNCPDGFKGDLCEINIDECASHPCQNNGTCLDMSNNFTCCCPEGYTGQVCETKEIIDNCEKMKCHNGGTCKSVLGGIECTCLSGFEGLLCERNIDDCTPDPCQHGATCIDGINEVSCICPGTHYGDKCTKEYVSEYVLKTSKAVKTGYAKLYNNKILHGITISFFMKTTYTQNRGTPFSYSYTNLETGDVMPNAITLLDVNNLLLYMHGKEFLTSYVANKDDLWHHYAITWEKEHGAWAFYVDGTQVAAGNNISESSYVYPGIFILGQEQDSLGGSFSDTEAFVGEIAEFNVWDYAKTGDEIKPLSEKCGFHGNVIDWISVQSNVAGDMEVISGSTLCQGLVACSDDDCSCKRNYMKSDTLCKQRVDDCSLCQNQQKCSHVNNTSFCDCNEGFSGRLCQYDVNECLMNNGNCSHDCINMPGSYNCGCPKGKALKEDNHTCFDTTFCTVGDVFYQSGDNWEDSCNDCECIMGIVECKPKECPDHLTCSEGEKMAHLPGHCCKSCVSHTTCAVEYDQIVTTFDHVSYSFHGECLYTIAEDCFDGTFRVQFQPSKVEHNETGMFIIHALCVKAIILLNGSVTVNDHVVMLPYKDDIIRIDEQKSSITLWTSFGLSLVLNSSGNHNVNIPNSYMNKLCGLCGNFNGKDDDDMLMRTVGHARIVLTPSLGATIRSDSKTCTQSIQIQKCSNGRETEDFALQSHCEALKNQNSHEVEDGEMLPDNADSYTAFGNMVAEELRKIKGEYAVQYTKLKIMELLFKATTGQFRPQHIEDIK